jgi:predicted transcriptional regulator
MTLFDDITESRHGGNACSRDAYERIRGGLPAARRHILDLIEAAGAAGLTSKEIAEQTGRGLNTFSGRLSELKRDGLIRPTGERRGDADVLISNRIEPTVGNRPTAIMERI